MAQNIEVPLLNLGGLVAKTVISRPILDAMIRRKLAVIAGCGNVQALPVIHSDRGIAGSNWIVPGFVGDLQASDPCKRQLGPYLAFLAQQFDIPEPTEGSSKASEKS